MLARVDTFTLASNECSGQNEGERTEYHACVARDRLAEICGQFLGRGSSSTSRSNSRPAAGMTTLKGAYFAGEKPVLLDYSFDDRKRQLPTKQIGLGLLLALAIRGLRMGGA